MSRSRTPGSPYFLACCRAEGFMFSKNKCTPNTHVCSTKCATVVGEGDEKQAFSRLTFISSLLA